MLTHAWGIKVPTTRAQVGTIKGSFEGGSTLGLSGKIGLIEGGGEGAGGTPPTAFQLLDYPTRLGSYRDGHVFRALPKQKP